MFDEVLQVSNDGDRRAVNVPPLIFSGERSLAQGSLWTVKFVTEKIRKGEERI